MTKKFQSHANTPQRLKLITTGLALLIGFALLMTYQMVFERRQLMAELHTEAAIIGANTAAALVFNDPKAASETLAAIRLTPRIIGGALYYPDGRLFATEKSSQEMFPQHLEANSEGHSTALENSSIFEEMIDELVLQDGVPVGTLVLRVTFKSLIWHLLSYALSVVLIGLTALLLTRSFTLGLRRRMALTEDRLRHMALYDQITGLPNRSLFEHELTKTIAEVKRTSKRGALLFIDVDDFKKVNDLCGHPAGDQVLTMIACRLKETVRTLDVVARVGGDEFAAILHDVGSPENAATVASKMITKMATPFATTPIPSHIGLSIGVAMFPNDGDDPGALLRAADMAMYEAKTLGKNRYHFFSAKINEKVHNQLRIEASLRDALHTPDSGLWVAYQPQVCAVTRRLLGVEALMRWTLGNGDSIPPSEFIPIAEKTGLITEVGPWLVDRVCRDLAELRRHDIDIPKVSINVSPRELTRGPSIVGAVLATLAAYNESVERIQFELTENALMDAQGGDVLAAFRKAGFTLAIDDFGSGYSSLGYLKRFQVSTLKIDRQFVEPLPGDNEDAAIVVAVIQMARALGIQVVAEGVETDAQAEFLSVNECDLLQGYLISRPIPVTELVAFCRSSPHLTAPPETPVHFLARVD